MVKVNPSDAGKIVSQENKLSKKAQTVIKELQENIIGDDLSKVERAELIQFLQKFDALSPELKGKLLDLLQDVSTPATLTMRYGVCDFSFLNE
ncbi:hypothetical protein ACFLZ2_03545 [Candidatus Margulisiibacteriota bacterium]